MREVMYSQIAYSGRPVHASRKPRPLSGLSALWHFEQIESTICFPATAWESVYTPERTDRTSGAWAAASAAPDVRARARKATEAAAKATRRQPGREGVSFMPPR